MVTFPKPVVIGSLGLSLLLLVTPVLSVNAQQNFDPGPTEPDSIIVASSREAEEAAEFSVLEFAAEGALAGQEVDEQEAENSVVYAEFQTIVDSPDSIAADADGLFVDPQAENDAVDLPDSAASRVFLPLVSNVLANTSEINAAAVEEIASTNASAATGSSVMGDFNGDFFNDLVIGVPYEDVEAIVDAGVIQVIYGTSRGLSTAAPIADQIWHQDSTDIDGVAEAGDLFGKTLAVGDFNNDGFDDLAIGIPSEDFELPDGQVIANAGAVHILYGSSQGLHPSAAHLDRRWHQDSAGILNVNESNDQFGQSLTAGDFNNDRWDDLAIGVPGQNAGRIVDAGVVQVVYGSDDGLHPSRRVQNQLWSQGGLVLDDRAFFDRFGQTLNAGDFNGDRFADLAIGVPYEDIDAIADAGGVNIIYGSATGLNATTVANQFWYQNFTTIAIPAQTDNHFGWSLAVGDFDGNGQDDLAIGAPNDDVGGVVDAGEVIILFGTSSDGLIPFNSIWHQNSVNVNDLAEANDHFGYTLAAGQFNRSRPSIDRWDDLTIGVPDEDVGAIVDAGGVHVIYGTGIGLDATNVPDQFWTQNSGIVSDGAASGDHFGSSLSVGRFGGQIDDGLIVGVPDEDIGTVVDAGAVQTIYGSANGLVSAESQFWRQGAAGLDGVVEANDRFGYVVQ